MGCLILTQLIQTLLHRKVLCILIVKFLFPGGSETKYSNKLFNHPGTLFPPCIIANILMWLGLIEQFKSVRPTLIKIKITISTWLYKLWWVWPETTVDT